MFTPLSKGSERAQDNVWDHTHTPKRVKVRPPVGTLLRETPSSTAMLSSPADASVLLSARTMRSARRYSAAEGGPADASWMSLFFRPTRKTVTRWLDSLWKRHSILIVLPCLAVWIWVAIPFPISDPYSDGPFTYLSPRRPFIADRNEATVEISSDGTMTINVNFYFFLFWYYGMYLAVALFFITNLFSLYRLNWWPSMLGGKISYALSWSTTLLIGLASHHFDLFHLRERWQSRDRDREVDWERKTFWVVLSFVAMLMPALACFSKLKKDKRHTLRSAMPTVSQTFFGDTFARRIPASWKRFLWFMTALGIACFSLVAGQAYASLFLSTLPHTSLDAGTWVWSWVITVQLFSAISLHILAGKVRSRALLFIYKLFFQLVYHAFYRNLFARLRSPSQFATVQSLSSISTIIIFPLQMTRTWHRILQLVLGLQQSWEDYTDNIATSFYVRGMAQNISMLGFLGWLTILYFGPNSQLYPFFQFSPSSDDPYSFRLTFTASCAVWASEITSSFLARQIMSYAFKIDVSQIGMNELIEYPELVPACGWAAVHVSMNVLLFLIKLNFQ